MQWDASGEMSGKHHANEPSTATIQRLTFVGCMGWHVKHHNTMIFMVSSLK